VQSDRTSPSSRALTDVEIERVVALATADVAAVEACREFAAYARGRRTGQTQSDGELEDELLCRIEHEVRRLALSAYPQSQPADWHEVHCRLDKWSTDRWLSDLPH
jgi:hypothetical protein